MKGAFGVLLLSSCLTLAVAQDSREPVSVPEETMQALLVKKVSPSLPEPDMRVQSPVVLKAAIDKEGQIEKLEVISGDPSLVPRALEAAKQWKYRPYEVNGIPTAVETTIHVEFSNGGSDSAPSDSSSQSRVPVSSKDISGHIVRKVPPTYPPLARQARIQGTVILRVIIDKTGSIANLQLVSGHPMLAPAAIEAVKQWKYTPYELNGEVVEVETTVQVNFQLANDPPDRGDSNSIKPTPQASTGIVGGVISGVLASNPPQPLEGERVSEAVMRPLRIQKVDPIYPAIAVQSKMEGAVVLDMRVDSSGNVEKVVVVSGSPLLARAAMEAVKQWKYTPYVKNGESTAAVSTVRLNFSLESGNGIVSESEPSLDASPPRFVVPRIARPLRVRVSSGVSSGMLAKKVAPEYPPDARAAGVQGTVVLQANIDKEGNVSNLLLVSGDPMLAPAAIDAVKQWKYKPYLLNGEAVEVETTIQVNFVLAQ